jgi:hypothetical protein
VDGAAIQLFCLSLLRLGHAEGHIWTFSITVKKMTPAEWDKVSSFTTKRRPD